MSTTRSILGLVVILLSGAIADAQIYTLKILGQVIEASGRVPEYAALGSAVRFDVNLGEFPMAGGDTAFMGGTTWYDRPATLTFGGTAVALPSSGYYFGLSAKSLMAGQSNFLGGSLYIGLQSSDDIFPSQTSFPLTLTLTDFDVPTTENYSAWTGMPGTAGSTMIWEAQWTPTSVEVVAVPEPATWGVICGVAALGWVFVRRRQAGGPPR